jgi:hypothetical protein
VAGRAGEAPRDLTPRAGKGAWIAMPEEGFPRPALKPMALNPMVAVTLFIIVSNYLFLVIL